MAANDFSRKTTTRLPYEEAIAKVTELLAEEGFGILSEIDTRATLKKKLDVDFKPYMILGACHPPSAYKVLSEEPLIGVLLPCNVVVWDQGDHRVVATMEPRMIAQLVTNPEIHEVADRIDETFERILRKIGEM